MPYDWRLDAIINTKYQKNLEKSIRKMRKITGKKVTLIAHSYGNINVYFNLMRYFESKADRQYHVNSFIALAPPFGGLILGTKFLIGATPMWTFLNEMFGLGYWAEVANGSLATSLLGSLLTNI